MPFQVMHETRSITHASLGAAQRIQLELNVAQIQESPQPRTHHHVLDVDVRTGIAQRLDTELVELPITAFLRTLVPEHRPAVPQALRPRIDARDLGCDVGA